jgi:uncharacterized membrane protein YagU involved in acid resistance
VRGTVAILAGGGVAGVLDISYAISVYGIQGVSPMTILHSIASGWYGPAAYDGGVSMAAVGALLHFGIALAMAGAFVAMTRKFPVLIASPIGAGVSYGITLFILMNFIVVPLSASPVTLPAGWLLFGSLFAHTALVGVPIALIARRCLASQPERLRS